MKISGDPPKKFHTARLCQRDVSANHGTGVPMISSEQIKNYRRSTQSSNLMISSPSLSIFKIRVLLTKILG